MTQTVLILGASGKFGGHAALAFESSGWNVRRFDRTSDSLDTAARGVDVIVNAWNMNYSQWAKQQLTIQPAVHRAALANDATVIIPGNVYVFGEQTPAPWSNTSPYRAQNPLGRLRIEMEQGYRDAGVRTIVLRAGDYLDTKASGNWFDKILVSSLKKGVLTYPGNPSIDHAWGYLPDLARASVELSEKRNELARFTDVCFPGYTLSGQELANALASVRGQDVRIKQMAWWPLRLLSPFVAEMKHLIEMSYLWRTPHSLDATHFDALLPDFEMTPLEDALRRASAFVDATKNRNEALTKAAV
ncbi:epimerase [Planktotalea sp.]|uniref:epimerase n=1 Tax=Planktotalea sp. TaxID=2029877 RepID=UPI003D6C278A